MIALILLACTPLDSTPGTLDEGVWEAYPGVGDTRCQLDAGGWSLERPPSDTPGWCWLDRIEPLDLSPGSSVVLHPTWEHSRSEGRLQAELDGLLELGELDWPLSDGRVEAWTVVRVGADAPLSFRLELPPSNRHTTLRVTGLSLMGLAE